MGSGLGCNAQSPVSPEVQEQVMRICIGGLHMAALGFQVRQAGKVLIYLWVCSFVFRVQGLHFRNP